MAELDQYYQTLELKPGASEEEIKQAYKDLLDIWDPERVSENPRLQERANEKLKEIKLAYEKLMAQGPGGTWTDAGEEPPLGPELDAPEKARLAQPPGMPGTKRSRKPFLFAGIAVVVLAAAAAFYFFFLGDAGRVALAKVNNEKITLEQFNKELARVEVPVRDMYQEEPEKFLEMMVVKTLLLQEAKKQGIAPPPKTYKDTGKETVPPEEALIAELMKKQFSSPPPVTPQEVEAFYSMFKDRMGGKPLKEVAPVIEQLIQQGKQQEALGQYIKEVRDKAKVEIDQARLKKIAAKPPESNSGEEFKKAVASGKPVIVDFGANSCVPCRQMRPVLKELGSQYGEKAKVLIIDIYKNEDLAREHKIQLIPTLVFFDGKGKEVFRHVGAWDKESIAAKLKEIGSI
jgi:thioredoxin 1